MFSLKYKRYIPSIMKAILLLVLAVGFAPQTEAQQSGGSSSSSSSGGSGGSPDGETPNDATRTGAYDVREDYRRANKLSIPFGPPTPRNPDGLDEIKNRESVGPDVVEHGPGPVYAWPVVIPKATSKVPTRRDTGIMKHRLQTWGLPISDTQYQMIHRMDQQIMLEEMFDPERIMWLGASIGTSQVQDTSNSFANVIRNQCASAIDFVSCYISNFTVEKGNRWNKIRDQLFMPMAILLLLPGAMLAQVRVIVAAGMPIGDTSGPFEGIVRSIVAIFLIPATYLVVNYSVDLNNSITLTIAQEYERIFGSNMYKDALCFVIRAFPIRQSHENRNGIYKEVVPWEEKTMDGTPASGLEGRSLEVKKEDPCSGEFKTDPNRADEQAPFLSVGQRFVTNSSNAVLAMTWNILCAFQVVFFMYLWLVGPVVAALWVYPHNTLRGAFPGWVEGVVTLAFWALFWNTVVLLMACFKGVDATGSIMASALLFLAVQSVKSAFDFAGLVKEAGKEAGGAMAGAAKHFGGGAHPNIAGGGGHKSAGHGAGGRGGAHAGGKAGSSGGGGSGSHAGTGAVSAGSTHGAGSLGALAGGGGGAAAHASMHVSGTVSAAGGGHAAHGLGASAREGLSAGERLKSESISQSMSSHSAATGSDLSGAAAGGFGSAGSALTPPTSQPGLDINISNSMLSSSSLDVNNNFSSFNASNLTGTVNGLRETYSASQAASLIGQDNLANFPREGQLMSREQAWANFNQAVREVDARNGREGITPESQQRNDLLGGWKSLLEDADKHASPDGQTIGLPDSLPGTTAQGNWELQAQGAQMLSQNFEAVAQTVNGALNQATAALSMPGAQGMPVNPQAVEGLTGIAREMTQIGPQLAAMSPQAAGATMEAWQQKAELLSQQMSQASDAGYQIPANAESYARLTNDIQQAQYGLAQVQQYYQSAAESYANYTSASYSQPGYGDQSAYNNYGSGGGYSDQYNNYGNQQAYTQDPNYPSQGYPQDQSGAMYQTGYYPDASQQGSSGQSNYPQQDQYGQQGSYGQADAQYSQYQQQYSQQDPYGQQSSYGMSGSSYGDQYQPQQPPQDYGQQYQQGQGGGQDQGYSQYQQSAEQNQAYGQQQGYNPAEQQGGYYQQDPYGQPFQQTPDSGANSAQNWAGSGSGSEANQQNQQYQEQHYQEQSQQAQPHQQAPNQQAPGHPAQAPHPNQNFGSMPLAQNQSMQRQAQAPQQKPADKPAPQQNQPGQKEEPRHALDPMKYNAIKQKAPEKKKKPEDEGPTAPPPQSSQ